MKCPKCRTDNTDTARFCSNCATPLHRDDERFPASTETLKNPIKELTTGSTFAGRYQVIEELGKGGMGRVYKVFDAKVQEKVALKLIKPEVASDEETIKRFNNELRLARKVRHKNVCGMFDLGEAEGSHFITMEYVPGQDLRGLIRQSKQLTIGTAVAIARQVCEGLEEAHRLGIVHRDLKPSNIIIDRDGNAKIMDFGIARSLRTKSITGEGVIIGTPEYMSPEQVEGKDADQRSDIFSLGVILFEMVTGRVPFEGETPLSVALRQKTETVPDPRKTNAQVPEGLSRLILKCLEKDKARRYQTAAELHADLEKAERDLPTTESVAPPRKPFTSKEITVKFSLKKLFVPALALIALIIFGIVFVLFVPKKGRETSPQVLGESSIAVIPFENYSDNKEDEFFSNGITEDITTQLSKIGELRVCPSMSVAKYRKSTKGAKEIGGELGVAFVLGGSIRRAGDQVRVTAQLIDSEANKQVWAEVYDRQWREIFSIQTDIALKIAASLKAKLTPDEKGRVEKKPTKDVRAYDYYLKGREDYNRFTKDDNEQAIELYNKALEIDPDYALAHAGLGDAYNQRYQRFGFPETWIDRAIEEASKAISLDPDLSEGYKALGVAYAAKRWIRKAVEALEKAVKADSNNVPALNSLGFYYVQIGEHEKAFPLLKRAVTLSPAFAYSCSLLGYIYYCLDDLAQAEEWLKKGVELQPSLDYTTLVLIQFYFDCGDFQKAVAQAQKFRSLSSNSRAFPWLEADVELRSGNYGKAQEYYQKLGRDSVELGYIYWKTGKKDEAREIFNGRLDGFQKQIEQGDERWDPRWSIAAIYAIQGKKEEALEWLQKAVDAGCLRYRLILRDPHFENFREETRFKEIIEKIKTRVDDMRRRIEKDKR